MRLLTSEQLSYYFSDARKYSHSTIEYHHVMMILKISDSLVIVVSATIMKQDVMMIATCCP